MRSVWMLGALCLSACTQYEFYTQQRVDVFQQDNRNQVDVLLIVDNSCSMIEEQTKLGDNFDAFIRYFEEGEADYQIGVITTDVVQDQFSGRLIGGDDELVLLNSAGSLVDQVRYDRNWADQEGSSLALDPALYSSGDNDKPDSWCLAGSAYGQGDLGSPGEVNPSCASARAARAALPPGGPGFPGEEEEGEDSAAPGSDTGGSADSGTAADTQAPQSDTSSELDSAAPTEDSGGADEEPEESGLAEPQGGQIIFTEIMRDPRSVADSTGEWVEITNLTSESLDLSGCVLADEGRNAASFPSGTVIPPEGVLVLARSGDSSQNGGLTDPVVMEGEFTLQNNVQLITSQTEGASEIFSELVATGISGVGLEMGFEAGMLALSEPLLSAENAGLLREEANLSILVLSDEDDLSPLPPEEYLRFFFELKGEDAYRDPDLMKFSAVVGDQPPAYEGQPSCSSDNGEASYGARYIEAVSRSGGLLDSICDEDFSSIAEELGFTLSGLELEFELSGAANENTLEVKLYADYDDASLIGTLEKDVDYSYLPETNVVRFVEDQVPPPESWIHISYELLSTGASYSSEEDTGGEG